jgi:hypothetical protein
LLLGHPTSIRFHPDSFLVVEDRGFPRLIKVIDLINNSIQELVPKGRGPGEMIVPWGIEVRGKDLYTFCGQLRKVIKFTPDTGRQFKETGEFILEEKQSPRFYPLSDNLMICLSNLGDIKRLTFLNNKGKIIKKNGDYPSLLNDDDVKPDNDIFFSAISATPDGNKFVLACTKTDVLEIYDAEAGLEKRYQGPVGIKLTVTKVKAGYGFMVLPEPRYDTYSSIIGGANEFWVSYNGFKIERQKPPSRSEQYPKQIFCFNWKGRPIRKIESDVPIMSFDIDWVNKILYSLELHNGNPEITLHSLNEIIN